MQNENYDPSTFSRALTGVWRPLPLQPHGGGVAVPLAPHSPRYRTHVSRKRSRSASRGGGSDMVLPPRQEPLQRVLLPLPPQLPLPLKSAAAGPAEGPGLKDRSCGPRQQGASANYPAHRSPSPRLGFYRLIFFTFFPGLSGWSNPFPRLTVVLEPKRLGFKCGMLHFLVTLYSCVTSGKRLYSEPHFINLLNGEHSVHSWDSCKD